MQSLFKKSLLVFVIAANGTIVAESRLCRWLGCSSTAPVAASTPVQSAAATVINDAAAANVTADAAASAAPKAVATPGILARMAACASAGAIFTWDYTLGSLWNLTAEMNNPVVNKITPEFYANFAKNNPYRLATILRSAAKLGIAAGVSYGVYVACKKLFGAAPVKKAKKTSAATTAATEEQAPSAPVSTQKN